eukprot:CAMPEP_0197027254 /NCGR_PEP_ID=MMETSP1384-20130603/7207_1 /TAXON_ID=29189 /ORGANISM="Ammonia sp." /LENGTH=90 /DNA_ID=CAMNT_0042456075 /DNA_START=76 /DNA_END=348 /DNA_ORIENTATION=+
MAQAAVSKKYEWEVGMTCNGCVGQVTKILDKLNEKYEEGKKIQYSISLEEKKVVVEGNEVDTDTISAKIKKWADLKEKDYKFNGEVGDAK